MMGRKQVKDKSGRGGEVRRRMQIKEKKNKVIYEEGKQGRVKSEFR